MVVNVTKGRKRRSIKAEKRDVERKRKGEDEEKKMIYSNHLSEI